MAARLTLKQAIDDLGWFWGVFTSLVNAPSLLSLLQMVFAYRFIDAIQWVVDGYNEIAAALGSFVEPWLRPLLAQLNAWFGWSLELQPHWKPLLLLALIPATSMARQAWKPNSGDDVWEPVALGVGAIVGVFAVAVVPLDGQWWTQGLMAAMPVAFALLASEAAMHVANALKAPINRTPVGAFYMLPYVIGLGGVAFGLAWGLSLLAPLSDASGLVALSVMVIALGGLALSSGLSEGERASARMGLTMLGAFIAAGLIVGADALVKILSA